MGGAAVVSFAPVLGAGLLALGAGQRTAGEARAQWRAFGALLATLALGAVALCVVVGDGLLGLRHHATLATLGLLAVVLAVGAIVARWLLNHRDDGGDEGDGDPAPDDPDPDWTRFDALRRDWSRPRDRAPA